MALPTIPPSPGIFSHSIFQSALHRLSSHVQKQSPSSSHHLQENLTRLHQSLQHIDSNLPSHTHLPNHILTQLKDISYSADDLVDDLEYNSLQREAEEFSKSNPYQPPSQPSVSQFRGFQTGKDDARNQVISDGLREDVSKSVVAQESNEVSKPAQNASGSTTSSQSMFKSLRSWISKMCKCLHGKNDKKKGSNPQPYVTDKIDSLPATEVDVAEPKDVPSEDLEDRMAKLVAQLNSIAACLQEIADGKGQGRDFGPTAEVPKAPVFDAQVYGCDDEKEHLIKLLLESDDENVCVVPIVGLGGIGKTTLAQYVYGDERMEKHFHAREWICSSDSFDMMRMAGELEESLYMSGPYDQHQLLDLLESKLKVELERKRFMLVLDDVRTAEWVTRLSAIRTGRNGSKILLTTREEEVLDESSKRNMIVLTGVKGEAFWSFFKRCSFGGVDPDQHLELQSIGKGIAGKLEGSPLAAKMVGGALGQNLDHGHWRSISRSELWDSRNCSGGLMPSLELSYKHLPQHLQRCFAYCSVFPKGYAFEIDKLVQMWMANGLIWSTNVDKSVEEIGREYFDHLLARSFFELPTYSKSYWRTKFYLMHELLHELAESVCSAECFVHGGQEPGEIPKGVRYLSVLRSVGLDSMLEWGNLRTLIINTMHVTEFEVLKGVRVLDLSHSYMKQLPDAIGSLTHLRYLNLSGNSIYSVPESLSKLYHLQTLLMPHRCHRLPKGMWNLVNLRHLSASDEAISWITGIGRLTCLQELKVFNVRKIRGHDLGQLKAMAELRGLLCIQCLDGVKDKEEAVEANLKGKIHIKSLQLKWMRWNPNRKPNTHEDVLESLQPPMHLEELEIHWYRGVQSPSWLRKQLLQNLKVIHLRGCAKWNQLPPLGGLPFLKILKIADMEAVVVSGGEVVELFPSLEELWLENTSVTFEGMQEVHEPGCKSFPSLHKLSVKNCSRLKGLPSLSTLSTLKESDIRKCPDLDAELPDSLKYLTSLTKLSVSELHLTHFPGEVLRRLRHLEVDSCEKLTSWIVSEKEESSLSSLISLTIIDTPLPTGPEVGKHLTCLQELRINRCSKLKSFAIAHEWFKDLRQLRELSITDCKSLRSLPSELHCLPSLEKLTISGCPMIRSLPTSLPVSLKSLEVSNCNPGLAAQWQDEAAPEWVKNIPYRYIV